MQPDLDRIDNRLERIEAKLDSHLERVAKSEEAISSMRGQIKLVLSVIVTAVGGAISYLLNHIGIK